MSSSSEKNSLSTPIDVSPIERAISNSITQYLNMDPGVDAVGPANIAPDSLSNDGTLHPCHVIYCLLVYFNFSEAGIANAISSFKCQKNVFIVEK